MEFKELKRNGAENPIQLLLDQAVPIASRKTFFCEVALYQLEGIYIEVFYRGRTHEISRVRTFSSTDLLAPYLKQIPVKNIFAAERACPRW
ncbi:hypothetical protein V9K67_17490 [Paraflavisolibacter sp. H34]|uniref:hypothetical protein n=1 Tax=Huijunlia imazamoxiresistens TaxID=3127457 RepID=UPI003015EF4C